MKSLPVTCGSCKTVLAMPLPRPTVTSTCPVCSSELHLDVFPALFRKFEAGAPGEKIGADDESSCYNHPEKKAVAVCEGCGRYLCALCEVDFGGRTLCPVCIERESAPPADSESGSRFVHYDQIALSAAVLPVLIWPFTLFTAPAAIYLGLKYFKRQQSIIPRSRWRSVLAIGIASLEVMGWTMFFISLVVG